MDLPIRTKVKAELRRRHMTAPSSVEWAALEALHGVGDRDSVDVSDAVESLRQIRDAAGSESGAIPAPQPKSLAHRQAVLALVYASRVDRRTDVATLRAETAKRHPNVRTVEAWIDRQQQAELGVRARDDVGVLKKLGKIKGEKLPYPGGWVTVSPGGLLGEICRFSFHLSETYPWSQADSTAFLIAGTVPAVRSVTGRFDRGLDAPRDRVHLSIDPAVSPSELAAVYSRIRQVVTGSSKPNVPDQKVLALAQMLDQEEASDWAQCWRNWNRQHPEWTYQRSKSDVGRQYPANFVRDARQAYMRLFGVPSPSQAHAAIEPA